MEQNLVQVTKAHETWVNSKWRPCIGWLYLITCAFDFIIAPIGWALLQAHLGIPLAQWNPLTLQGAGLYHLAMGAILGITAWSRGQEKMSGVAGPNVKSTEYTHPREKKRLFRRDENTGDDNADKCNGNQSGDR